MINPLRIGCKLGMLLALGAPTPMPVAGEPMYDLSRDRVLYCVAYAHLDTQWRWDFCTTIDRFIKDTLDQNFERFEQFPEYVFNFTGSVRYEMMKEYYPKRYERLKQYIAAGRWHVSGSSVDEGDVNVPSAEATIRQVLYGNQFFRREFGRESLDYMLPDCFGFPASMPSIWAHCGLKGFSTQKLTWGSAVGIPFKIGVWEGPDGNSVLAALDPGPYVGAIEGRVDRNPEWVARIEENGRRYGVWADYHYFGVGDQGGAPRERDVRNYIASRGDPDSPIKVALVASDQMFKDITAEQKARLPRYRGDLLLTEHSAGTLTSQAYMKRWNRKNEILADAAERAAVAAHWLGGAPYPREKLYRSWVRVLANQMHDILPGTSIPRAYRYSWNDEIVALNGFAAVVTNSTGVIARALDTRVSGVPLVVYNALAIEREDLVEAVVRYSRSAPRAVRIFDPQGREVPTQILSRAAHEVRVLFIARCPPVSWSVFDVRPAERPFTEIAPLRVSRNALENEHYRVRIDANGDVDSIIDKHNNERELLAAPAQMVFTYERPRHWPAWNMDWFDRRMPPIDRLAGPAKMRILERGPVRVVLAVERRARNSIITQRICLAGGAAGRRIEFHTTVDWQSTECALKASFPLAVSNPKATYNWGLGTIERGNNSPTKYEVPSHEWFDLTDESGEYGVSVLEDCKYGSDKPSDREVRLTLLHTPGVRNSYVDQHSQDWGRHDFVYALYGHAGDWRNGHSEWQGRRLNQPLRVFQAPAHPGALGRSFSFASVSTPQIDLRAVKIAEDGSQVILRLQELWGRPVQNVEVAMAGSIVQAIEVDGQERRIGDAVTFEGKLRTRFTPYQLRSFAVRLASPDVRLAPAKCRSVDLPWDTDVASRDNDRADGSFDVEGRTIPAEMLPDRLINDGIEYDLGSTVAGQANAVSCRGQTIALPQGDFNRVYLLAAATEHVSASFILGDEPSRLSIHQWTGFIGQWDDRVWDRPCQEIDHRCDGRVVALETGYVRRDPVAWFCTHLHHPERGNEAYKFCYLFQYRLDRPAGANILRLPDDPRIKILALTTAQNANDAIRTAAPLYDDFTDRESVRLRHVYPEPGVPVFAGADPAGTVVLERAADFNGLSLGTPSTSDYADLSTGNGIVFRYFDGRGKYRPHADSGTDGDALPRLNDGEIAENADDPQHCIWYDNEGRFFVELLHSVRISRINTFSRHSGRRTPQFFSVWGSNAASVPSLDVERDKHDGWTLLGVVDSRPLGQGGVHGSSIQPPKGQEDLGPYRHLLWVAEDAGQGTFFTEIDIHVNE